MKKLTFLTLLSVLALSFAARAQYVDLGLSVNWAACNLGAKTPSQPGNLYAWGETSPKNEFTQENYKISLDDGGKSIVGTNYDAAYVLLGGESRLPTEKEFLELCEKCTWTWEGSGSVPGYRVTGPSGNEIFLPAPSSGLTRYWSGTLSRGLGRTAIALELSNERYFTFGDYKWEGAYIRPVCDNAGHDATADVPQEWKGPKYSTMLGDIMKENYSAAYTAASRLANAGDSNAAYLKAAMEMCGAGCERDYEAAQKTLRPLAANGDLRAQYMLGGFGSVAKSYEAMQLVLGTDAYADDSNFWFTMMGNGVPAESFKETLPWFFAPLEKVVFRDIMFYAGCLCLTQELGYMDMDNGLMWINAAAEQGYPEAIDFLNQLTNGK